MRLTRPGARTMMAARALHLCRRRALALPPGDESERVEQPAGSTHRLPTCASAPARAAQNGWKQRRRERGARALAHWLLCRRRGVLFAQGCSRRLVVSSVLGLVCRIPVPVPHKSAAPPEATCELARPCARRLARGLHLCRSTRAGPLSLRAHLSSPNPLPAASAPCAPLVRYAL